MRLRNLYFVIALFVIGIFSHAHAASDNSYKDFKLKVPSYKQQYANSCESSALRMALAYKGIVKDDVGVLTRVGYNPKNRDWTNNVWDDPQKQFVGFVDVSGKPNGGYGVYGLPIKKAAESFGRQAEYATGTAITAQFLAKELDNGNPIVIWGYTTYTEPAYTWNTPDGGKAIALKGEHARTVVGYRGTASNPVGFYVHDPINGKANVYWSAKNLIDHIQKVPGVTDQAVVVR